MSAGFFGIQFGWGLQMANTSAIFERLGANPHQIPILWLAAPLTGLVVQPIIGNLSDNTWGWLGRRRPYFLVGAILSSLALVLMPNSSSLWMAAGLLWLLDTSVNVTMEPFRAFVGDLLPANQRTKGFAMQSLLIGLGSVIAAILPWLLTHWFKLGDLTGQGEIPLTIKLSFYSGAAVFLGTVLWTVLSTDEKPPKDMAAFERQQARRLGVGATLREIADAIRHMPPTMRQLAWVQGFSWLGMYCMFLYFPPAVAHNIFGAYNESAPLYAEGIEWAGVCIAMYNAVCFVVSLGLPHVARRLSRQVTHALCLIAGGVGLMSLQLVHDRYTLLISMVGVGCAWASMLAMPYAMLVGSLPAKKGGIYMGIFNAFIVLPEIVASLGLGWMMQHWLNDDRLLAVVLGGGSMVLGAIATLRVQEGSSPVPSESSDLVTDEGNSPMSEALSTGQET
ncbi:MAG: MFS transporter [Leptolyngbya sp. LCM1.Bin17]|nr:MAG: MFS transporter [Leptolyngbya sp. LCM1.Bin17]